MNWSLENELCATLSVHNLERAFRKLAILKLSDQLLDVQAGEWIRGGAETYIYPFSIYTRHDTAPRRLIMKAYTPRPAGIPLEQAFQEMFKKRAHLVRLGLNAPTVYYKHNASWIEDYVDQGATEFFSDPSPGSVHKRILFSMHEQAATIVAAGYRPLDVFGDFRTDGSLAYYVDFGSDLGGVYADMHDPGEFWSRTVQWIDHRCPALSGYYRLILGLDTPHRQ